MKNNWPIKKLGEICDILDSKRKPVTQRDRISGEYPYYGATGIQDYVSNYIFDEKLILIGEDGAKWGPGEDTAFIAEGKYWVNNHAHVIRPHRDKVLDNWIVYFLNVNDLSKYITGLTVQKLNQGKLREIEIPLPSLIEQKRILETLDKIFVETAKATESAEKNSQNIGELFESYLQNTFAKPGKGWKKKTLKEVLQKTEAIDPTKKPTAIFKYIDVSSVNKETKSIESVVSMIGKDAPSRARKLVRTNDVIFATIRPTHSRVAVITKEYNEQVCSTGYFVLRTTEILDNKLVFYFLLTNSFNKKMAELQKGASYPAITDSEIKKQIIHFPASLSEQKIIVKKLDAFSVETKKLRMVYRQKFADLEELKQSVLKEAFSGQLSVPVESLSVSALMPITQVSAPSPYVRNQVHAAIIDQVARDGGWTTEVAVAKYDHLLQEVFGLPLGYQFQTSQFGPFDTKIKRLVSSGLGGNKWFTKRNGMIIFGTNIRGLLFRQSNIYRNARSVMQQLSGLGVTKLDAEKVELLSTVCHSIKTANSTQLNKVRDFMSQWPTDNNRTKAEKFSVEQTQKCLDFIVKNNLHQRLLKTI